MFCPRLWDLWVHHENQNYNIKERKYHKKGYLHLDNRIWFPEKTEEIKKIVENGLKIINERRGKSEFHSFFPFLKILTKTPRYRYQFEDGLYDLETKIRPICFASHKDSLLLGYYSFALTRKYENYIKEKGFDNVVLAYRSDLGKCNIQFGKEVFDEIKSRGSCSAIALDIKGYFDHIDHKILKKNWEKVIHNRLPEDQYRIFKILTEYSYINRGTFLNKYIGKKTRHSKLPTALLDKIPGKTLTEKFSQLKKDDVIITNKSGKGIPQGSPISALLSNIFLIDFDEQLKLKATQENFSYRRYCDDILIVCAQAKAKELMDFVIQKIKIEYGLTIQEEKVNFVDFQSCKSKFIRAYKRPKKKNKYIPTTAVISKKNENKLFTVLQYLGFEFNGEKIFIRSSSLSRYFWKLNYRLQRTVIMSYSPKSKSLKIFLNQIFEKYSHFGRKNFLTYAYNAL